MKIELHEITVGEVVDGYADKGEEGVVGYGGKLDIRPKYQREFVYDLEQKQAVIETILKGFPLNVMYWVKNGDTYEVLDGQQRTLSFCDYENSGFSIKIDNKIQYYHNLTKDIKERIDNYKLFIYICEGTDTEKLDWFKTVNIAGVKLTDQELRNITYTGEWLTDAKRYFSRKNCAAYNLAKKYMNGTPIRQEYLETVLKWITNAEKDKNDDKITGYMAEHQHDHDANELWMYFKNVIDWVDNTFTVYRSQMKGLGWGYLYNKYKDRQFDINLLEEQIAKLMRDDDVTKKSGIYWYVLDGKEQHLNIRAFTENMKREAYERQQGVCPICGKHFDIESMEGDHITPWASGGRTNAENCQMLCKECNRHKSDN